MSKQGLEVSSGRHVGHARTSGGTGVHLQTLSLATLELFQKRGLTRAVLRKAAPLWAASSVKWLEQAGREELL